MAPRLLVIKDEEVLLFLYQLILEPEVSDIQLAASGLQQVMDIDHFPLDLIISDYHLGRYGRNASLWQQPKADPLMSALPPLLCTADTNALHKQEGFSREAGVRVALKPFDIGACLQTLRQALQGTVV